MTAITTVKLVLAAVVLVTELAGLLLCALAVASRDEERSFPQPQTDETGR